ncbi:MAG: GTPase Era [Candidatus Kapabacteria bacterium]|jgi:GTP-binding protein Era|nr:GTPase Era [Candidatus Kapabacteria bacterium]
MPTKAGFIALTGKPNVGKSTLMNAILGTKLSIVTPKPQTTRKSVLGIYSKDDLQIVFLDTPGVLKPKYELHRSMMQYVSSAVSDADAVAVLIDSSEYKSSEEYFPDYFLSQLKRTGKPLIAVLNKLDKFRDRKEVLPILATMSQEGLFDEIIPLSALKNQSVDVLLELFEKYIPESEFYYDPELLSDRSERFFVSEMIREVVFTSFRNEIPYSTEVNITEFKEREEGKWYISASIIVERKSQKIIVVGKGGEKIRKTGEKARVEIEDHLGMPVFLDLFVVVREKWRNNKNLLDSYGYNQE